MEKRGFLAIQSVVLTVLVLVLLVAVYSFYFKPDLLLNPGNNACDPADESCVVDDGTGFVEDCSIVTPDRHCVKDPVLGWMWDPDLPGCGSCGPCGELETPNPYEGTAPDSSKPCELCNAEGDVANAPEGSELDACSRCGGFGDVVAINEGQRVLECTQCSGGEEVSITGPFDKEETYCKKCDSGMAIDKNLGEFCNVKVTEYGKSALLGGGCEEVGEELGGDLQCMCNQISCQIGEKKSAVPSLDPVNDQKGYVTCTIISTDADGDVKCSKWPPEPEGVTACNTCSQEFDSAKGCINLDKAGKKALKGDSCKYKSWFGLGKIKSGTCNGFGSCKKGGSALFSWAVDAFGNALDKTEEILDAVTKCQEEAVNQGFDIGGVTVTPWSGVLQGPQGATSLKGFKCEF